MTERSSQLFLSADRQIADLLALISTLDEASSRLPCQGREKLGDGTVAACVRHTADNYQRIAGFISTSDRLSARHDPRRYAGHRTPRLLGALGHGPASHAEDGCDAPSHDGPNTADNTDLALVATQLSTTRCSLEQIAELSDSQLHAIPPEGTLRFCDGQRTLEQVLASLLKHQAHQLDALSAAI
jgi:hypothetical protein